MCSGNWTLGAHDDLNLLGTLDAMDCYETPEVNITHVQGPY